MKKRRITAMSIPLIAVTAACLLMAAACGSSPQETGPMDPMPITIANFSLRNPVNRAAVAERTTDADGGEAFFISDAKSNLDAGAYRVVFTLDRPVNIRAYRYLVFEMMADNIELLYNIQGFFPRFFTRGEETWVQFGCSEAYHAGVSGAAEGEWFTINAAIQVPMAGADNLRVVFGNMLSFEWFIMTDDMIPIDGRIYFRNIRFE